MLSAKADGENGKYLCKHYHAGKTGFSCLEGEYTECCKILNQYNLFFMYTSFWLANKCRAHKKNSICRKAGNFLKKNKICSMFLGGILTLSLVTGSIGGTFVSTALAATPESAQESTKSDQGIVTGLVAVGLLAMLSHSGHSSHDSTNSAAKSTGSQPAAASSTSNSGLSSTKTAASASSLAAAEQQAFKLLNADRAKNGLSPLKLNSQLTSLAESYAKDMINRNFFSHTNPEGQSPFDRMKNAGISYSYAGENIAINTSVSGAETAFMNSSGHRANILSSNYTDVGIGVGYGANGSLYVVQEFIR